MGQAHNKAHEPPRPTYHGYDYSINEPQHFQRMHNSCSSHNLCGTTGQQMCGTAAKTLPRALDSTSEVRDQLWADVYAIHSCPGGAWEIGAFVIYLNNAQSHRADVTILHIHNRCWLVAAEFGCSQIPLFYLWFRHAQARHSPRQTRQVSHASNIAGVITAPWPVICIAFNHFEVSGQYIVPEISP